MNTPDWLSISLSLLVMVVGLIGVVVPILPGVPLIWLGVLVYVLLEGFGGWAGGLAFGLVSLLTLASVAVDLLMGHAMARRSGTSWLAVLASVGLGLVGLFFFPPLGAIVGAVLGMFLVEYWQRGQNVEQAWRSVSSYLAGLGWSAVAQIGFGMAIMVVWGVWVFLRGLGS